MKRTENKGLVAVFDIDETLLQSGKKLKYDVVNAMARLGVTITPEHVSEDWYHLAQSYGFSREQFDAEFDKRKSWEQSLRDGEAPLYEDAIPCLEALKAGGVRLAALSKSIPKYTDTKLEYHKLRRYFEQVETVHPKEPNKVSGALNLIQRLNPETIERAWFIGDKPEDITLSREVSKTYPLSTGGIYVNRESKPIPEEIRDYPQIAMLDRVPEIILGGKDGR